MIEVERTFVLTDDVERSLVAHARYVGTKQFTDVYWDTATYDVMLADTWLRQRDGRWELKLPRHERATHNGVDLYKEIEDEPTIRAHFKLPGDCALEEAFRSAGYEPCAEFVTTRRTYEAEGLHIDLDEADFGHRVGEVEAMVSDDGETTAASARVDAFLATCGIVPRDVLGKIGTYLHRHRPGHFKALVDAGIIRTAQLATA